MLMPTDRDLFAEERAMPTMSFGEHIEDLRRHLILALLALAGGLLITFIPGLNLGQRVMLKMQEPAQKALDEFYAHAAERRAKAALDAQKSLDASGLTTQQRAALTAEAFAGPYDVEVPADQFAKMLRQVAPKLDVLPDPMLKGQVVKAPLVFRRADLIQVVHQSAETKGAMISLTPLESFMMYFMVCVVTGLVIASPVVFYQIWAFIAAGLYKHERHYVKKFLPFSIGLFLGGVALCFFLVLPITLQFLLEFNVWLGIEPTLRITEWIGFATILPLVFGISFQTPLVMLMLERIGILSVQVYREKRKFAVLIIVVAAAVITPTGDPFTMMILAVPMYLLYELGIILIGRNKKNVPATSGA